MAFPKDFVWGVATSSYQIEGAVNADGRKPSVWDAFARKSGAIWNAQNGDKACDHYHRYAEDIALMKELGVGAYRLSIAWPRVLPDGTGAVNAAGLAFYDKLIDALLAAKITPWVTLYHWDHPEALHDQGGWLNPESPRWFADYTQVVVDKLSGRVTHWFTLNEPQCFIGMGMFEGLHAPGEKRPWKEVLQAGHHALLAHGRAVQVIRARSKKPAKIGYAPVGCLGVPASDKPEDIAAAKAGSLGVFEKGPWNSTWWMDPVYLGQYPADGLKCYADDLPQIGPNDLKTICQPLDFCGVNIYQGPRVKSGQWGLPERCPPPENPVLTANKWPVVPELLYWGPKWFYERYKLPVVLAENGLSCMDWVARDGKVHDPQRIDYTARHLLALERATSEGVSVGGYFHWSFMDNFEWAEGYKERFGLVYVDFETQKRTPKDSFYWYRDTIRNNGVSGA